MFTNYWNLSLKITENSVNEIWVITAAALPKLKRLNCFPAGYSLVFMDEFVYNLLTEERACDIIMPRLAKRQVLEENGDIGPRKSRLLAAMEGESDESDKEGSRDSSISRSTQSQRVSSRSHSRTPSDAGSRYVSRSPSRSISRSPSPSHDMSNHPMDVDTEYHNS